MNKFVSVLTPAGVEITVPEKTFRKLRNGGFLFWNADKGLRQLRDSIYQWTDLLQGSDPTRPRPVRARRYGPPGGRSEKIGDILVGERKSKIEKDFKSETHEDWS